MPQLLLELFSEEIPARMQSRAAADLKRLATEGLKSAGLTFETAAAHATPRRLTLVVDGLPAAQADVREERRGPRADAPDKAVDGFLRAAGLTREACEVRSTDKGDFLFAVIERRGQATAEILPALLSEAVANLPWPKSMRWGSGPARWVRPLHDVLCLFDGAVVPVSFADLTAADRTRGHRFHAPDVVTVKDFDDYRAKLTTARVMLDAAERRARIKADADALAAAEKLTLTRDDALLDEVAGLVEWPVTLMGRIDADFMSLPPEVLVTSMRAHQKYLSLNDANGKLAPRFMVVANLEAEDGGAEIVAGNERVLRARLADARFFWDQDRKRRLEERVPALRDVVFHARLGTLAAKVDRMEALAGELADRVPGADRDRCRAAALLAKADLSTEMVGEFPELQGIMGRYYARHDGEHDAVAEAIAEHYSPLGPSDRCPTAPTSVAVALADKIDTLVGFFAIDEKPTGSKDPFALRRAALGVSRLILENNLRLPLLAVFRAAGRLYGETAAGLDADGLLAFFADRLKVHLRERGVRHDLISAVFALPEQDDLVRLMARVDALNDFIRSDDGINLLTAHRRAANILRIEAKKDGRDFDADSVDDNAFEQPEENRLFDHLGAVRDRVNDSLRSENFQDAFTAFASLRPDVDAFFDEVTVNASSPDLRENRLKLLSMVDVQFSRLADFSQIEG